MQEVPAQVPAIIEWMQNSAFGTGIRESVWTFPVVETTHVLSLVGWGMKHQPISRIHKQIMPYVVAGFFIEVVTGFLLFWAEAEKCYLSVFFRAKVLFLFLAAFNAIIFEFRTKKTIGNWDKSPVPPPQARMAGWLSIVSWSAVIVAGRATAYNLF